MKEITMDWVLQTLTRGRQAEKAAAVSVLARDDRSLDDAMVGSILVNAINGEYSPERSGDNKDPRTMVRGWLITALSRVAKRAPVYQDVLRRHLDVENEPNFWARYWALEGLLHCNIDDLETICRRAFKDEDVLSCMTARVIMASRDDEESLKMILQILEDGQKNIEETGNAGDAGEHWAVLRGLRFVFIPKTVKPLGRILAMKNFKDYTYDAIMALGAIPPHEREAEDAAGALVDLLVNVREYQYWDALRTQALEVLGRLKVEHTSSLLINELTDPNPAVARAATLSLEKVLGPRLAVTRVIERLASEGRLWMSSYASALRNLEENESAVTELERVMISGNDDNTRENARRLLGEVGGSTAMEKLRAQADSTQKYLTALQDADKRLRELFDDTISHARKGFRVVLTMDIVVFYMGIVLLGVSAGLAIYQEGDLSAWTSGLSGAGGVAGILFGRFVGKPRQQVDQSVLRLSLLQQEFLGYLRQLNQIDQCFTRRLLDGSGMDLEEMQGFEALLNDVINRSNQRLMELSGDDGLTIPSLTSKEEQPAEGQ
ncbi:MAG: hypothetical protein QNK37_32315 [Acidobacteriota bacterium]|nr:hypothetical protein [Acidobacteriota bacterium]